ncbi:sensor histidine kinase [Chitinophaga sp. Hz27]|uniref:sensor histidine kinase n=1 Tax=Chitinophaga sp. Hz27 TaxID=3347169 RepID=UPI0035D829AD
MNIASISERIHNNMGLRAAMHILFWMVIFATNVYTTTISFNIFNKFDPSVLWELAAIGTISLAASYYAVINILVPWVRKRNYAAAIIGFLLIVIFYALVNALTEKPILEGCSSCMAQLRSSGNGYAEFLQANWSGRLLAKVLSMGMLINLIYSLATPLAIKLTLQSFRQRLAASQLEKENIQLEFNFLKSQINPHFLFNSLNNIYGLILKTDNERAASTVAQLSAFLRYTIYNQGTDSVPLSKEIQLLRDYVSLEKVRLNHTNAVLQVTTDEQPYMITSLLLLPVLENAFKFSADKPGAYIRIVLLVSNGHLDLQVVNTVDDDKQLKSGGGIGLQNLRKRLELFYPGKYQYTFNSNDLQYQVKLQLVL